MKKYMCKTLLGVLIIVQILYTVYAFVNWKQGAHTDEVWSYGLSNSYYHPFLGLEDGKHLQYVQYSDMVDREKWIPGTIMKEYLTVQKGEQFAYASVYDNNTYDVHPPFYHMLLHTVCSFFPDQFSWWYGFSLNLIFLVGTQIFLYLTVQKITGSEATALATCLFYGGGKGALLTFTFVRQYSLLVMLCVIFTYYSACFYDELVRKGEILRKYVVMAAITAGLTFATHYYGIAFVGTFTAAFCVYLLLKRRVGAMLFYGFSMLIALAVFFAIYPSAIYQILTNSREVVTSYSPRVQIRMLLSYLFQFNYGFTIRYFPTAFWNITLPLVGGGVVAVTALLFPFRDEPWFPKMQDWLKDRVILLWTYLKRANYVPIFALAGCAATYEITAHSTDVLRRGVFVMRYISVMIPFAAMAAVIFVRAFLAKIPKLQRRADVMLFLIICTVLIRVHVTTGYPYTHRQVCGNVDVVTETKGKNVLVVDRLGSSFFNDITYFSQYFYDANSICFTSSETIVGDFLNEGYDERQIDYVIADTEAFRLSEKEKRELEARGDVAFAPEDAAEHPYACTELIKAIAQDRPYEIMAIWQGQMGVYYILKFSSN
ncbi:MAG: DUF2029 domain-containing protein [Lachnospiraceae bacterium]|nr:DUF2029 domain-containing protein [Lachnospiraceae bacterium]